MNDKELLEMAAKAAGIKIERFRLDDPMWRDALVDTDTRNEKGEAIGWNPLDDDGDALRLAVRLRIHQTNSDTDAWATHLKVTAIEPLGSDHYAATRLAIVRAAAEIGRNMP
jgi:hypothetical protein